ncbi:MAG: HD domain-containing protein [Desulfobacterales bacterium]|nr:HD domain-containing protein [Desulfobacterales bacterium]
MKEYQLNKFYNRIVSKLADDDEGIDLFYKALRFSFFYHEPQFKIYVESYITHLCSIVDTLLFDLEIEDSNLLAAALLYDILEEKDVTIHDIENIFGAYIATIVHGCDNLTKYISNRQKILFGTSKCIEVLLIVLSDRFNLLKNIGIFPPRSQQRILQEIINIYAPIASIINLPFFNHQLYELALQKLFPRASKKILNVLKKETVSIDLKNFIAKIIYELSKEKISVNVRIQPKCLYDFYDPVNKVLKAKYIENLIDLIVVLNDENILDSYRIIGILNSIVPPINSKISDFIANPKSNGYKSLHIPYIVKGKQILMIIRTPSMDRIINRGMLAHLLNKEKISNLKLDTITEDLNELFNPTTRLDNLNIL